MFWNKQKEPEKRADNVDYNKIMIRMTKLEAEMLDLTISLDTIRNKVLRKIQTKRTKDEEESPMSEDGYLKTT